MSANIPQSPLKRVVIVGGGFAGLELVNRLKNSNYQIVLIDKNNYHEFLPLIYQVGTAGLESSSIAFPFRKLFHNRKNFYFRLAVVRAINYDKKVIQTSIGKLSYDYLVLAGGTQTNYFGNERIQKYSIPMKNMEDALGLRNTLLANFERALTCATEEERKDLLNVVIIGGGATGVEVAGAIAEMKRFVFPKDYPDANIQDLNITLIEGSGHLLASMSDKASENAKKYLTKMGVNIRLNTRLKDYDGNIAFLESGEQVRTRTLIWVSGVTGISIGNIRKERLGRGNRILVNAFNQLEGLNDVFCIGDLALNCSEEAYPNGHPQLAQVAIQQARMVARNLPRLDKNEELLPFTYKNLGSMATVGRNKAVADLGNVKLGGKLAWSMWLVVHLKSILGVRNKFFVLLQWVWNYFTYDRSSRFIIYPRKNYVIKKQEEYEETHHLGQDL